MPDLLHALQGNDLEFLRMVANAWGLELLQPDAASALPVLVDSLKDAALLHEVLDVLPQEALEALKTLFENDGKMLWAAFCRKYGEVRPMGPGKRDRERPDLKPTSITEVLWYRALVAKAFFDLPPEPQEFAFIPDDLAKLMSHLAPAPAVPLGHLADSQETAFVIPVNDRILDHACTLLAAIRAGIPLDLFENRWPISTRVLLGLLHSAGLVDVVDASLQIQAEVVRSFLEAPRGEALLQLAQGWLHNETFNDLRYLEGLVFEGQWDNRPLQARMILMDLFKRLPQETWWSLTGLVSAMREKMPDFQRPGGDYDSWFIRKENSETYLRGFSAWDEVDGALIRFIITVPMHWLGWYDLAHPSADAPESAFRLSSWASDLWQNVPPSGLPDEDLPVKVLPDGRIRVPTLAPRSVRYQIARFCEWESELPEEYRFRLTPGSLDRAAQQGLRINHLLVLLKRYAAGSIPPVLVQALERWEKFGVQAALDATVVLRLASPEILAALRKSRASRHLGEALTPTVIVVKPGGEDAVRHALADLGYLTEDPHI